jgi:hypothetical protein
MFIGNLRHSRHHVLRRKFIQTGIVKTGQAWVTDRLSWNRKLTFTEVPSGDILKRRPGATKVPRSFRGSSRAGVCFMTSFNRSGTLLTEACVVRATLCSSTRDVSFEIRRRFRRKLRGAHDNVFRRRRDLQTWSVEALSRSLEWTTIIASVTGGPLKLVRVILITIPVATGG